MVDVIDLAFEIRIFLRDHLAIGIPLVVDRDGAPTLVLHNSMNRGHWLQIDARGHGRSDAPEEEAISQDLPFVMWPAKSGQRNHLG